MKAEEALKQHPEITHIAMIHSETTTGILNDIQSIGELAKTYHKVFIVDAMSSFAGVDIPMHDWHIDFLVSSANKCIQGVPGFSFIIARRELLIDRIRLLRVEKRKAVPYCIPPFYGFTLPLYHSFLSIYHVQTSHWIRFHPYAAADTAGSVW